MTVLKKRIPYRYIFALRLSVEIGINQKMGPPKALGNSLDPVFVTFLLFMLISLVLSPWLRLLEGSDSSWHLRNVAISVTQAGRVKRWQEIASPWVPAPWASQTFAAMEGQPWGLICMESGRKGRVCNETLKEEQGELPRNDSNRGVCRKIKYQVVTSLYESYLLAGSFTLFLT